MRPNNDPRPHGDDDELEADASDDRDDFDPEVDGFLLPGDFEELEETYPEHGDFWLDDAEREE
jgi:hypothetical protein